MVSHVDGEFRMNHISDSLEITGPPLHSLDGHHMSRWPPTTQGAHHQQSTRQALSSAVCRLTEGGAAKNIAAVPTNVGAIRGEVPPLVSAAPNQQRELASVRMGGAWGARGMG